MKTGHLVLHQARCIDEHDKNFSHQVNLPGTSSGSTESPHHEVACNEGPSNSTHCQLLLSEHEQERLPAEGHRETAPELCNSFERAEISSQQEHRTHSTQQSEVQIHEAVEAIDVEIPVNSIHPVRFQENLPSGRTCYGNLVGGIQQDLVCSWSHPSAQLGEVPVQGLAEDEVVENEPTIGQDSANTFHGIGVQVDLPLERTCSGHLGGCDIQSNQVNQLCRSSSIDWDPSQVLCTDPMQNELFRVLKQEHSCTEKYENKKFQLKLEYEQELGKVKSKFEALLQGAEREYLSDIMLLRKIYQKVSWHKDFADEVGVEFFNDVEGLSTTFEAPSGDSQPDLPASSRHPSRQPPPIPPRPLSMSSNPTASVSPLTSPNMPISRPETSPRPLSGPATPHSSLRVIRVPAPHLQRYRPPASFPNTTDPPLIQASGQPSPVCSDSPQLVLPHCNDPDDLLESMLTDFVGHDPVIYVSDDE